MINFRKIWLKRRVETLPKCLNTTRTKLAFSKNVENKMLTHSGSYVR